MKARFSALIILLANIVILAHAAIPHYHGDDMIATILHLTEDEDEEECATTGRCHHDGEESHDDGHCLMNDTMMASICREDDSDSAENSIVAGFDSLTIAGLLPILYLIPEPVGPNEAKPAGQDEILYLKEPLLRSRGLRAPPRV